MASLNKVILIGNLGKDPELRYTQNQTPFARFSLATSESFTTNGEKREKTTWHNLVVWGKQAEIAQKYLQKGKQIYVEGSIDNREYDDQNGNRRNITDIRVQRFLMLGSRGGGGGGYDQAGGSYDQGGGYGSSEPQSYGGGAPKEPAPMSYGGPVGGVPESDDFNDDDIPF